MCFSSPSNDNSALQQQQQQAAQQAAQQQAAIQQGQAKIQDIFSGYNPDYYNNLSKQYTDYYTPQVQQQEQNAQNALLYSQANQGITNSSGAQYEDQLLNQENALDLQTVQSGGQDFANSAKQQVGNLESNLTNQLNTSYDPSQITPAATNQLNIPQVSSLTPLSGLFSDLTNVYGDYANNVASTGQQNAIAGLFTNSGQSGGGSVGGSAKNVG